MLDKLFNSKIRVNILALFFRNQKKELYPQEIINLAETDPANTHKELKHLKDLEVLKSKKKKKREYYFLDTNNHYFKGLNDLFKIYNELEGEEKFAVLEEMPDYAPFAAATAWSAELANVFLHEFGIKNKFSKLLVIYDNNYGALCVVKSEFDKISQEIINKFLDNPDSGDRYNALVEDKHLKLFNATENLVKINLSSLSNRELLDIYNKNLKIYEDVHRMHWIQTTSDFGDNLLSKYLLDYLKAKVDSKKYSIGDIFSILTTPLEESYAVKEYKELLEIFKAIYNKRELKKYFKNTETRIIVENLAEFDVKIDNKINQHVKKWGWMGYGLVGPAWGKDYFIDLLCSFARQGSNPQKLLEKQQAEKDELRAKQKKLFEELIRIDQVHLRFFKIAQGLVYSKGIRKDSIFKYFYALENFYKEICRRFYLSMSQVRYLYHHEFKNLLLNNRFDVDLLNSRRKYSIYYSTGHYSKDLLLEGDKARKFIKRLSIIKENIENIKLLQGDCASSGRARGEVTLVNTVEDIKKMKEGNVLVSIATNPNLVSAIKKSAAIVTDIGGITCHAAIISRELGIPCVIGTRIATKVLKDGNVVDVDATHGKVTIIK